MPLRLQDNSWNKLNQAKGSWGFLKTFCWGYQWIGQGTHILCSVGNHPSWSHWRTVNLLAYISSTSLYQSPEHRLLFICPSFTHRKHLRFHMDRKIPKPMDALQGQPCRHIGALLVWAGIPTTKMLFKKHHVVLLRKIQFGSDFFLRMLNHLLEHRLTQQSVIGQHWFPHLQQSIWNQQFLNV